jgi:Tol biopolymer transport system component
MDADGSNVTQVTNLLGENCANPRWSPDGNKIIFANDGDGNYDIYTMNKDGTGLAKLMDSNSNDIHPNYSPDGSKIIFMTDRDGNYEIYSMDSNGSNLVNLTNSTGMDNYATFSPDGSKILFASNRDGDHEIYIMDSDGNNLQKLTDNNSDDQYCAFSPDGQKIAFVSKRDGGAYEIYIMNKDGTNQTRITNDLAEDYYLNWASTTVNNNITSTINHNNVVIQDGANVGQNITINRNEVTAATLGLSNIDVSTQQTAEQSISKLKEALNSISDYSSYYGATYNRLEHKLNFNKISLENQTQAESRIRDTNYSEEMMKYTKTQIVHQASLAMLSQSNINSSMVMRLL